MAACQPEEDGTAIPEDMTNQQEATTSDSSSTPESETFTTLIAWGANHRGQLGNGTTTDSSTPVEVSDLVGVRDTAAGHSYSLALKDDGTVLAWGYNNSGQLGNGTNANSTAPVLAETFVEQGRFAGTCYRAANWQRLGESCGRSRGDRHHRLQVPRKALWVYPLCADFRARLCA